MPRPIRIPFSIPSGAQYGAPRAGGRHHQGTDYHCAIGTSIYGTRDGGHVVANVGETGYGIGFGNYVSISYPGGFMTLDGHLRERSPLAVGTTVNSDTVIAFVGITGNAVYADPPGSHDHHQLWVNGNLTDPEGYYTLEPAGTGGSILIGNDMLADEREALFVIKQLLTETNQWMGIGQMLGEVYKIVGITKQLISETVAWEGMDARTGRIAKMVEDLEIKITALQAATPTTALPLPVAELATAIATATLDAAAKRLES